MQNLKNLLGMTFKGKHNSFYKVGVRSIDRTVSPPLRTRQIEIDGRHGIYDFGGEVYGNRGITVEIAIPRYSFSELRSAVREVAYWLSGSGRLFFDDEPDKYYDAKVSQGISLEQISASGVFQVKFDCQPFAYAAGMYNFMNTITASPGIIEATTVGTQETPVIITLVNQGAAAIEEFSISVEYEVEE